MDRQNDHSSPGATLGATLGPNSKQPENAELQPRLHPDRAAPEPDDAGAPRKVLHPVEAPPPWPYARTQADRILAVEDFAACLSSIVEEEYGDWMRRANTYWWHLAEALENRHPSEENSKSQTENQKVAKLMLELQNLIQLNPDFRLIETRRRAVEIAMKIRTLLGAKDHLDIHDFALSESRETSEPPVPSFSDRFKNSEKPDVEGVFESHEPATINASATGVPGVFHG